MMSGEGGVCSNSLLLCYYHMFMSSEILWLKVSEMKICQMLSVFFGCENDSVPDMKFRAEVGHYSFHHTLVP